MRIRQIVVAARNLAGTVKQLEEQLGLRVVYRDPGVAAFGLENALLRIGDQFLEVVAPTRPDTAAGRHLDRHGDSGYMLILQTDDLARDRARVEKRGVRVVWESKHADISAIHLHPKDMGAAIVSLDEATPPRSWRWAGTEWDRESPVGRAHRVVSATISARDPAAMAQRWSEVLGLNAPEQRDGVWHLALKDGVLMFNPSPDGSERLVEFGLAAAAGTLPLTICGTRFVAG